MEFFIIGLKSIAFIIFLIMLFQHFSWPMLAFVLLLAALIAKDILVIVNKRSKSDTESSKPVLESSEPVNKTVKEEPKEEPVQTISTANQPESKNREHTDLRIYRHEDRITRLYYNLKSNDEVKIIEWLHQQGFCFEMLSGSEDHDIGDQDYFSGHVETNNINEIASFLDKLYGSWGIDAVYHGIQIRLNKQYPNIYHSFSFAFPRDAEELLAPVFRGFQEEFCYQDIIIDERIEIDGVLFKLNS